jgi:hypothetical protein
MKKTKLLSLFLLLMWIFLLVYSSFDAQGRLGSDIGLQASLATSSIARVMFMDIGVLSTLIALFIATRKASGIKYLFALLTLVFGSFAALPFLAYYYWTKEK